jgi:hypothetical protein
MSGYYSDEEYKITFRQRGFASCSGARTQDYFNGLDKVLGPDAREEGLRFTVIDPAHLDRGREHYLTISYRVIDADYERRHGAEIEALRMKVLQLENVIGLVRALVDDKTMNLEEDI